MGRGCENDFDLAVKSKAGYRTLASDRLTSKDFWATIDFPKTYCTVPASVGS